MRRCSRNYLAENGSVIVHLDEIEKAIHLVIEHLNNQHIAVAELPEDYYWEISEEQRYDPAQNPKDLSLGQLSEDWDRVQQIVKGDAPPVGYALVWLASLLRKIGSANVA